MCLLCVRTWVQCPEPAEERKEKEISKLGIVWCHSNDRPAMTGQTPASHQTWRARGLKRVDQKPWAVLNWFHLVALCPSTACIAPEITPLDFNTDVTDGTVGFKMPTLSPFIKQNTQITFPLKVFSYQNMKRGNFKWNQKTKGEERRCLHKAHQQTRQEYFN